MEKSIVFYVVGAMLINLTPHTINLLVSGALTELPRNQNQIPRIKESLNYVAQQSGVHIYEVEYGATIDVPPAREGTLYIVSRMISESMPGRDDLVFPLMLERNAAGKVTHAKALGRVAYKNGVR